MKKRARLGDLKKGTEFYLENGKRAVLIVDTNHPELEVWIDVPDEGVRVVTGNGGYAITCDGAEAWHGTGAEAVDVLARILRDVNNNPARSKNVMVLQVWLSSHLVSAKLESESKRFQ